MGKIRLMIWADAVVSTGFARVMHSIVDNLPVDKYDVYWLGVNYRGDPHEYKYKIYPAYSRGDLMGMNRIKEIYEIAKPDLVFALTDIWGIGPFVKTLTKDVPKEKQPKIVAYFPVDAFDHDPDWYEGLEDVTLVTYTQFAKAVATEASKRTDIKIIPHGVDTSKFFKMDIEKKELKKHLFGEKEDYVNSFVFLNANRNQPRKRLDVTMEGFALFSQNKPKNVKLYMHCGMKDSSIDIPKLATRYGINDRLIITTVGQGIQNVPVYRLNMIYNACEVGVNTSLGEGWGLTAMEHGVIQAPQINPRHSACVELFEDCGLLTPINQWVVMDNINTTGGLVSPVAVAYDMEQLYGNEQLYQSLSKRTFEKFTKPEYAWSNIAQQWDMLFDEVLDGNNDNLAGEHSRSD